MLDESKYPHAFTVTTGRIGKKLKRAMARNAVTQDMISPKPKYGKRTFRFTNEFEMAAFRRDYSV